MVSLSWLVGGMDRVVLMPSLNCEHLKGRIYAPLDLVAAGID